MTPDRVLLQSLSAVLCGVFLSGAVAFAEEAEAHSPANSPDVLEGDEPGDEPQEILQSLDIRVQVLRTGKVEIEQSFVLELVEGGSIERGPILDYLSVYRGLGDLVLHNQMQVQEISREGKPEPFRVEDHGGITRIVCGAADVFLPPGPHHYTIRFQRNADWIYRDGQAHWSFDITESFKHFPIEALSFELKLPDGVEFAYCTPALSGSKAQGGTGYEMVEVPGRFEFRTTAPLREQSHFFLNAGWESKSFATQSQWFEVMRQHPKLPLTGFIAIVLFGSLIGLIVKIARNHQVRPAAVG